MCKYCEGVKEKIAEYEERGGWKLQDELRDIALFEYDPTGCEGNGDVLLFANGVQYDVLCSDFAEQIPFRHCPMCGKPLHSSSEPINEPEYYYLVRDDCGEYSIYDREAMAKEFAEEVAANVGVAELIRVKVDAVNACEVRCCWDDE